MRQLILLTLILTIITACTSSTGSTLATLPLETITSETPIPIDTELPGARSESPTLQETIWSTFDATVLPQPSLVFTTFLQPTSIPSPTLVTPDFPTPEPASAAIQIYAPGPLSREVSPIKLRGFVIPGWNNLVRVELFGEDGRLLVRQILRLYSTRKWAYLSVDIPFEIHAAGELGRLTISTEDQYGRTQYLNSVHLILLPDGFNEINPAGNLGEHCIIQSPLPKARVSGGILLIEGEMRPFNSQSLLIEIVSQKNQAIASRLVAMTPTVDDSYIPFIIDIPYMIEAYMWARLTIQQADERISGPMYIYSQEVLLYP